MKGLVSLLACTVLLYRCATTPHHTAQLTPARAKAEVAAQCDGNKTAA